jgi:hypothetical protein
MSLLTGLLIAALVPGADAARIAPAATPPAPSAIVRACEQRAWQKERDGQLLRADCVGQLVWRVTPPRIATRKRVSVPPPLTSLAHRPAGAETADAEPQD